MKAIVIKQFGGPEVLTVEERPTPQAGEGELLVRVRATALNRADILQRLGKYPPPPGVTDIPGLEMAGEIASVGPGVTDYREGDRVCALLPGGGYAEYVAIPAGMAMPIPDHLTYEEAAAIPEAFLTAYLNLWWLGGLQPEHRVLVHAGASGVGTAALQLIHDAGAAGYATAGSQRKLLKACELGARASRNYRTGWREWIMEQTDNQGVNIVLDFVGAPYFEDHLQVLTADGKLIVIGTLGGAVTERPLHLGRLLAKRLQIIGTTLRTRSIEDKIRLTREFAAYALPRFADGRLKPVIDSIYELREAAEAHRRMEANENIGKMILRVP